MPNKPKVYICMGFYLFGITKEQIERPKIAKDKHKMILEDMKITLKIMKLNLKDLDVKQLPTTNI